jgi:hypothetical protein
MIFKNNGIFFIFQTFYEIFFNKSLYFRIVLSQGRHRLHASDATENKKT